MSNLATHFRDVLLQDANAPAVLDGRWYTRNDLIQHIAGVAVRLNDSGMVAGDRVLIQLGPGVAQIAAALAILGLGAVPVLAEPGQGDAVYLARTHAAAPEWVVSEPAVAALGHVPGARAVLRRFGIDVPPVPDEVPEHLLLGGDLPTAASWSIADRAPQDEAAIVFTSGTTAAPKGVRFTHAGLSAFLDAIAGATADLTITRLAAETLPQALYGLRLGRAVCPVRGRRSRRPDAVRAMILDGTVDATFAAPWLWRELLAHHRGRLPASLRTVLLGSAPVSQGFLIALRDSLDPSTEVRTIYGLTETGPVCVATDSEKLAWTGPGDWVGRPVPGVRVTTAAASDTDGPSELLVYSPSLYAGYLREPARPADAPLQTGDLAWLIDGAVILAGRSKDMIIRRGVNLYPALLEPAIRDVASSKLDDLAMVGVWDATRQDEQVFLFAVPAAGQRVAEADVQAMVLDAVGEDARCDHVVFVESLPVSGRQAKVDRKALRDLAASHLLDTAPGLAERLREAIVPFGFEAFTRKYATMLRDEGLAPGVVVPGVMRIGLWTIAQGSWALDELLTPGWREARGLGPIFIIGHQRSGTTLLHRLLAADVTHARALTLQEMLLPSNTAQAGLDAVARLDHAIGDPMRRALDAIQERTFGPMDKIHRLRLQEIEEDEFALWAVFNSIMCANDAPTVVEHHEMDDLRHFETWSDERQHRVIHYYRDCLARRLYRDHDGDPKARWMLSKNPAFTQKIKILSEVFPDARFVYLVRDPLLAIPSRLSMLQAIWRARFPDLDRLHPGHVQTMLEDSYRTYLAAERDLPALPEARRITIRHHELRADPRGAVHSIYQHFGLPGPDAALEARLDAMATKGAPPMRGDTLASFGLDEANIRRDLAPVFAHYGY